MTCPHRRVHDVSTLFNGHWATARRCNDCGEWVPWGEASDTEHTALEVQAAWAAHSTEAAPYHGAFTCRASFWAGWASLEDMADDWEENEYASGALARSIVDHEEE